MLTKKKCKEALEQLDLNCWGCEYACDMSDDKPCVLKEIIGKLIDEHFDNSAGFNHFKLHADSTLKTFKKDELIDYIHILYHNWQGSDWAYNNVVKANFQLLDEINKLKSNRKQAIDEKIY